MVAGCERARAFVRYLHIANSRKRGKCASVCENISRNVGSILGSCLDVNSEIFSESALDEVDCGRRVKYSLSREECFYFLVGEFFAVVTAEHYHALSRVVGVHRKSQAVKKHIGPRNVTVVIRKCAALYREIRSGSHRYLASELYRALVYPCKLLVEAVVSGELLAVCHTRFRLEERKSRYPVLCTLCSRENRERVVRVKL